MNEKPGHLTVQSDNLAVPEIHTHEVKVAEEEIKEGIKEEEKSEREGSIHFDNVAIPEFHIKKKN